MIKTIIILSILSLFFMGCSTAIKKVNTNKVNINNKKNINKNTKPKSSIFKGTWKPINNNNIKFEKVVG